MASGDGTGLLRRSTVILKNAQKDQIHPVTAKPKALATLKKIWKSACLAVFLLILGSVLLILSAIRMWDSMVNFEDRIAPLIILGCMSFIPGAYHCWVFACASFEVRGYTYEDIPLFN